MTNRKSKEYIKWVQSSLNKVMKFNLVVDGISGSKTKAAIRDFQKSYSLAVDGIMGPITEAALIKAGASNPPGGGRKDDLSEQELRDEIVKNALAEWNRWKQGAVKEGDLSIRPVLESYWKEGVKWLPDKLNWWSSVAWSAAFISWIMRQSNAGDDFKYSAAHATYVAAARENRLAKNGNRFKAYRINEIAPKLGDLVCKPRESGVTYDNIRRGHETHCDIVVGIEAGNLLTIGGNVSHSVSQTQVSINGDGFISNSTYIAIVTIDR